MFGKLGMYFADTGSATSVITSVNIVESAINVIILILLLCMRIRILPFVAKSLTLHYFPIGAPR